MKRTCRTLVTTAVLSAVILLAPGTAYSQDCQPGIEAAFQGHAETYTGLFAALMSGGAPIMAGINNLTDQPSYAALLASARSLAGSISEGRVLIALPGRL